MFAIVEFNNNKKEFFVVPLIWLSDDKKSCFWPKNVNSQKHIQTMVEEVTPPKDAWTEYPIRKVHNTAETYSQANISLQLILAESSTSTSELEKQDHLDIPNVETTQRHTDELIQNIDNLDIPNVETTQHRTDALIQNSENSPSENDTKDSRSLKKKRKVSKKRTKFTKNYEYSSDSEDQKSPVAKENIKKINTVVNFSSSSDEDLLQNNNNNLKFKQITTPKSSSFKKGNVLAEKRTLETFNEMQVSSHPLKRFKSNSSESPITTRTVRSCSTSSIGGSNFELSSNTESLNQWQQSIIKDLETIKTVQEQQSTLLTQIWQTLQVKNVQALQRPPDVPDFPVGRIRDFGTLEEWLETSQNFIYMRTRLASIGGSTIRSAVMNMLKFVISNKVGMAFNWAGSAPKLPGQPKKYSFRETLTYKALNEAAKISFQGLKEQMGGTSLVGELTDKSIGQACQDWLKLAKQRYMNNSNK